MANLLSYLETKETGHKKPRFSRCDYKMSGSVDTVKPFFDSESIGYRFSFTFGQQTYCKPKDLPYVQEDFKKLILREVYGDYCDRLHDLRGIIFEGDDRKAIEFISKMMSDMMDTDGGDSP